MQFLEGGHLPQMPHPGSAIELYSNGKITCLGVTELAEYSSNVL